VKSSERTDANPEEQRLDFFIAQADAALGHWVKPPLRALLQQLSRMIAFIFELRLREFLIIAIGDDTGPIRWAPDLVDLNADPGVGAHPFDFLPEGGKNVDVVFFIRDADWHNIRLVVKRAAQACHRGAGENFAALGVVEFVNSHSHIQFHPNLIVTVA